LLDELGARISTAGGAFPIAIGNAGKRRGNAMQLHSRLSVQYEMNPILPSLFSIVLIAFFFQAEAGLIKPKQAILFKSGISNESYSAEWKKALESRMPKSRIDSLASIKRELTSEEKEWLNLIRLKLDQWNSMRDSLMVPFGKTRTPDVIYVMVGFLWRDDGFTFGLNTVCLDVTALFQNYGAASLAENSNRIDRIFAHEFTHVIHKNWVRENKVAIKTFRDSILWECLYEGIGMYRSLNARWLPKNGVLPNDTQKAMNELTPIFINKLHLIQAKNEFKQDEKEQINANLSRGPVNKKWGAFPVAIWLFLEANGSDKNLRVWIEKGPNGIVELAEKYSSRN
jgi:hypothetical protein